MNHGILRYWGLCSSMELYVSVEIMNYSSCVWHINRHEESCAPSYISLIARECLERGRERGVKYLTLPRGGNVSWSPASISYHGAQKALSFVESWYSYGFGIMAQMLITVNRHTHTHRYTHSVMHTLVIHLAIEAALGPGLGAMCRVE